LYLPMSGQEPLTTMKICFGVLAHNEEARIGATLGDLLGQDLWAQAGLEANLLVVVNGSSDRTAERARDILAQAPVASQVVELEAAGKANAWNRFVHELSPADASVLGLVDADIRLPEPDTLSRLLQALQASPQAVAAVDQPLKDLTMAAGKGLAGRLSLSASELAASGPPKLCGQLYLADASSLRRIYLPEPMLVEDGFIKAMLVTEGFSRPEDPDRLVRAEGTYHLFEAETRLGPLFRHEKRILIGTLANLLLFDLARDLVREGKDAADWMRSRSLEDPQWFRHLIQERLGRWGGPRLGIMIGLPLRQLRQCRGPAFWRALPGALARLLLNLGVAAGAALDLRSGRLRW
jgi:glycosyltransferase involved in cell wall biosynthesis